MCNNAAYVHGFRNGRLDRALGASSTVALTADGEYGQGYRDGNQAELKRNFDAPPMRGTARARGSARAPR
jgi:hypothetical protein